NNGGTGQQAPGPIDATTDEDIDEQFAVNFRGHWTAMTAEAALMRRAGHGAIVNTSSIGSRRANPMLPAYGAMKRALNSVTESAAVTWAPDGIRVNGITPGGTATEMIDAWEEATPGIVAQIAASTPMGRMAEPHEVAEVAAWLLSDRASMVTGAIVPVDGGAGA
ncbi:MAG: SDR family oxidoreductase, partial [Aeromicrobium sp.]